ncbi:MAG: APC family permease [Acidobacteriaceae bacterium]
MNESTVPIATGPGKPPRLRRVLTLWDLILYGIILIMPIAAVPLFGLVQQLSHGHAVTTILLAMVAMVLTAYSYGRMASLYPSAGSAYVYVGRGLNAHLGFMAGWAMFLDYLLVPLVCTIYAAVTLHRLLPEVPYMVWAAVLVAAMTFINLRGMRATSGANLVLLIVMMTVVLAFIVLAVRFLFVLEGWHGLFATQPFYDPHTFHVSSIATATSLAALTYGGFDGVSTLSEDARNPRRDVLLATVLVCVFTGIFGGLQIYLAQRVWPDYQTFANIETAFMDVARRVGGPILFEAFALILIVANLGSGMTAQAGLSRLLFGMGRDGVIPSRFFTHLSAKRSTPVYSLWFIGIVTFAGALVFNYEQAAELINFGAFLAFMGVNAATIRRFYFAPGPGHRPRVVADAILPALGLLFCLAIWLSLPVHAKILGGVWFVLGIAYDGMKTDWFRKSPAMYDLSGL